jgi:hypothetical protein
MSEELTVKFESLKDTPLSHATGAACGAAGHTQDIPELYSLTVH